MAAKAELNEKCIQPRFKGYRRNIARRNITPRNIVHQYFWCRVNREVCDESLFIIISTTIAQKKRRASARLFLHYIISAY